MTGEYDRVLKAFGGMYRVYPLEEWQTLSQDVDFILDAYKGAAEALQMLEWEGDELSGEILIPACWWCGALAKTLARLDKGEHIDDCILGNVLNYAREQGVIK